MKVVPLPFLVSTMTLPPCASTMRLQMGNPSPIPLALVVKKASRAEPIFVQEYPRPYLKWKVQGSDYFPCYAPLEFRRLSLLQERLKEDYHNTLHSVCVKTKFWVITCLVNDLDCVGNCENL